MDIDSAAINEETSKFLNSLSMCSYVPDEVLTNSVKLQSQIMEPSSEEFEGVICMADIRCIWSLFTAKLQLTALSVHCSGFTALNVYLASQGSDGPEKMSSYLNEYFDKMINIINELRGDIIKFGNNAAFSV